MTDSPLNRNAERSQAWAEPSPVEQGGRVELRLLAERQRESATYQARWLTSKQQFRGEVRVSCQPLTVDFGFEAEEPPKWLVAFTRTLLRTTIKGKGEGPWPRRLTRWRDEPRR